MLNLSHMIDDYMYSQKPVLRGHIWDKEKVTL